MEFKGLSVKNLIILFVAGVVNAIGVTMFFGPVGLYDSGFAGTSMFLGQITGWSLSIFLIVLNVPFFLYGYRKLGAQFTIYSLWTVGIFSVSTYLITYILPIDVAQTSPFAGSDLLLCAIFGGIISGVGSGLAIRYGGAIDGIEVIAVVFAKRLGLTVGTFVMFYNVFFYMVAGFVLQSWILSLYSIIAYGAAVKTVDFIVEGLDKVKSAMIVTTKEQDISRELSEVFGHGVTHIDAKGYYSDREQTIIYFVVNRFQIVKLKNIVMKIDPEAFVTISEVSNAFGKSIGN